MKLGLPLPPLRSIRLRLRLLVLATVLLTLAFGYLALLVFEFRQVRTAMVSEIQTLGEIVAGRSGYALAFLDRDAARDHLKSLGAHPAIEVAAITDAQGALFTEFRSATAGAPLAPPSQWPKTCVFRHGKLETIIPIRVDGQVLGQVYLRAGTASIDRRIAAFGLILLAVLVLSGFLATYAASRFQKPIIDPILHLADTAQMISTQGRYDLRVDVRAGDQEIQTLGHSFNDMIATIQDRYAALKRSEDRAQGYLNTVEAMIVVLDDQGRILRINRKACEVLGWAEAELVGRSWFDLCLPQPEGREVVLPYYLRMMAGDPDNPEYFENQVVCRSGQLRDIAWHNAVLRDDQGRIIGTLSAGEDITVRKQNDLKLQVAQRQFRDLVDSTEGIVWEADASTFVFTFVSQQAERLLGYPTQDWLTPGFWAEHLHPEDRDRAVEHCVSCTGRLENHDFEYRFLTRDGRSLWLRDIVKVVEEAGKPKWLRGVMFDISKAKALEEQLQRTRIGVERASDAMYWMRSDGSLADVNEAACRTLGYSREALLESSIFDIDPITSRDNWKVNFEELRLDGSQTFETVHQTRDGRRIPVEIVATHVQLGGEAFNCSFARDITGRKRNEEQLRLANFQGDQALDLTAAGYWHVPLDGSGWYNSSARAVGVFGDVPREDLRYRIMEDWFVNVEAGDKAASERTLENYTAAAEGRIPEYNSIYAYKRPVDGHTIWIHALGRVVKDVQGNPIDMYGVVQDITEQVHSEQSLQQQSRLQGLLMNISARFINLPLDEVDSEIRHSLEEMALFVDADRMSIYEYDQEAELSRLVDEWNREGMAPCHPPSREVPLAAIPGERLNAQLRGEVSWIPDVSALSPGSLKELLENRGTRSQLTIPIMNGEVCLGIIGLHWIRHTHTYSESEVRLHRVFAGLLVNLRLRRNMEAELLRHRDHLEDLVATRTAELQLALQAAETASQAKTTFLASMSHELRTPLNAVLGFSQLMAREAGRSPRDLDKLEKIRRAGEHLLELINDVLSISRIEAQKLALSISPFDLRACLEAIEEMIRVKAEAKHLEVVVAVDPRVPAVVEGDEGKLRQVLINLLGNAVKFTEQGRIGLKVSTLGQDRLRFEVSDTGPGISPEELHQLFGSFVQTEAGRRSAEGTGLGLNLSQALARLMGGEIRVESEPGRGSIFRFEIPLKASDRPPLRVVPRRLMLAAGGSALKQLVVDDQANNRELLTEYLDTVGFPVQAAQDGQEAVEVWRTWHPDVIWMDMRMPVMDGYEAARRIRALEAELGRPRTVILAITASAFEQEGEAVLAAGCDGILHKPFREQELFDALVRFARVEFLEKEAESLGPGRESGPPSLEGLDPAWRQAFTDRLRAGEVQEARRQVSQLPANQAALAAYLQEALQGFRLDELERLFARREAP